MKLIDILVRELKVWPEDSDGEVGQCSNGRLHGISKGNFKSIELKHCFTVAEDYFSGRVSKAQWLDAVTALEVEKVKFSDPMKMNSPVAAEWNGEGLPPVGTEFESKVGKDWVECIAVSHDRGIVVFRRYSKGSEYGLYGHCYAGSDQMRPIRTAEQIAAEERDSQVVALHDALTTAMSVCCKSRGDCFQRVAEMIYDAGFSRKQVAQ